MKRFIETLNRFFRALENHLGLAPASLLGGLILLGFAAMATTPRWELFYHGQGLSRLSMAPFDLEHENDLRFRILSPLLGYLLFLKGPLLKYLMLVVLAVFLGSVYFFHRKKDFSPAESFGIGALMAFSTLAFYQLYFPAYNDPTSFLLMLSCLFLYRNKWLAGIFLSLMLFNHDNTLFVFPFFFLFMLEGNYSIHTISRTALVFLCAIIPYAAFRWYMATHAVVEFNTDYYFDPHNMQWTRDRVAEHFWSGFFQAFRLFWIFPLGAIGIDMREKRWNEIFVMIAGTLFVLSQLFIAYDISRLIGMSFPVILLGAWRVREFFGVEKFSRGLWIIIFLNFLIPPYCIGALDPIPYPPFWITWIKQHFLV